MPSKELIMKTLAIYILTGIFSVAGVHKAIDNLEVYLAKKHGYYQVTSR